MASVTTFRGRRCTKVRRANVTAPADPPLAAVTPGPVIPLVTVAPPAAESTPNISIKVPFFGSDIEPEPAAPTAPNAGQQANKDAPKPAPPAPTGKVPEVTVNPDADIGPISTQVKSLLIPAAAETPAAEAAHAAPVVAQVPEPAPAPAPAPAQAPSPAAAPAQAPAAAPPPAAAAPAAQKPASQAQQQNPAAPAPQAPLEQPQQAQSNNQPAAQAAVPKTNPQPVQQSNSINDPPGQPAGRVVQDQSAEAGPVVLGSFGGITGSGSSGSSGGGANGNVAGGSLPKSPVVGITTGSGSGSAQQGQTDQLASNGQAGSVLQGSTGADAGSPQANPNGVPIAQGMQAEPILVNGTPVPQQSGARGSGPRVSGTGALLNPQGGRNTGAPQVLTKGQLAATGTGGIVISTDSSGKLVDSGSSDQGSSQQDGTATHVNTGAVAGGISAVVALVMIGALLFFCIRKRGFGSKRRSLENPVLDRGMSRPGPTGKLGGLALIFSPRRWLRSSSSRSSRPAMSEWTGAAAVGRSRSPRDRASSAPPSAYRDQMRTMMGRRSPSESTVVYPAGRYSRQEQGQPPMLQTNLPTAARRLSASSISQGIYSTSPHDNNDNPFRDPDPMAPLRLLNPDKSRLNTPAPTPGVALGSPSHAQYFPAMSTPPTMSYPNRPMHRRVVSHAPDPFADPATDPFADPDSLRSPVSPMTGSPLSAAAAARIRLSHELQRRGSYNRRSRSIASIPSSIEEEVQSYTRNGTPLTLPHMNSVLSNDSGFASATPHTTHTAFDSCHSEQLNSPYSGQSSTHPTSHPFSPSIPTPPTPNYENMAHSPMSPSNRTSANSSFFNFANAHSRRTSADGHKYFFYNNTRPSTGAGLSDVASRVSDPFDLDRPELYSMLRAGSTSSTREGLRSGAGSPAATERKGSQGFGLGIGGIFSKARDTESPILGYSSHVASPAVPTMAERKPGPLATVWPVERTP